MVHPFISKINHSKQEKPSVRISFFSRAVEKRIALSLLIIILSFLMTSCYSRPYFPEEDKKRNLFSFAPKKLTPKQKISLRLSQKGEQSLLQGKFTEASSTLSKAIDLDPSNPFAYYFLGETHYQTGEYQLSIALLEKTERLLGNNTLWRSKTFVLIGSNYEALKNFPKAISFFEMALNSNKHNVIAKDSLDRIIQLQKKKALDGPH